MGKGASLGEEAVLADAGRAGERSGFFSMLLEVQGVRLLPKSGLPMMPVLSSSSPYGTQIL